MRCVKRDSGVKIESYCKLISKFEHSHVLPQQIGKASWHTKDSLNHFLTIVHWRPAKLISLAASSSCENDGSIMPAQRLTKRAMAVSIRTVIVHSPLINEPLKHPVDMLNQIVLLVLSMWALDYPANK